jgi:methionine-rich copper-binding protein CopC
LAAGKWHRGASVFLPGADGGGARAADSGERLRPHLPGQVKSGDPGESHENTGARPLWFNEQLEAALSRLSVVDTDKPVDSGDVRVGPDDLKRLSVGIPALAPGTFTVRYRVLSVDGHVVESQFSFTVHRAN